MGTTSALHLLLEPTGTAYAGKGRGDPANRAWGNLSGGSGDRLQRAGKAYALAQRIGPPFAAAL
eukprot:1897117-Prymnesium_polylepis.1